MKLKNYCRRVLYVNQQGKLQPPKLSSKECAEEDTALKSSDDEEAVQPEDATLPAPHNRPPSYNPEDYAQALARFARTHSAYIPELPRDKKGRVITGNKEAKGLAIVTREMTVLPEMSTRQFASLPELLKNLKEDLSVAYISFVKELVQEPHDGTWLLLDLLRSIQHAQAALHSSVSSREQQGALRRALLDEHACLSCLRYCLRCANTANKLAHYQHGLYSLTVATMTNLARSRTVALQLLTRVCESSTAGHKQVLDALSTLRLRFAESVRFKFLVSMLQSQPTPSFAVWTLRLLNSLVSSAESLRQRIHLQEELVEAGFDPTAVKKTIERNGVEGSSFSAVTTELERWQQNYVDVSELGLQLDNLHSANKNLSLELINLREANMKLLEENVLLKTVGGEVQEQYIALQKRLEQNGLPSAPSPTPSVTDSDISSVGPVRRGTVLRRPSRSSSSRSCSNETVILDKGSEEYFPRSSTPDVLPRKSLGHVNSDTFTYASGLNRHKNEPPEPLPRSTSLYQNADCLSAQNKSNSNREIDDLSVLVPCYVNPMDMKSSGVNAGDTLDHYTPPERTQSPTNDSDKISVNENNYQSNSLRDVKYSSGTAKRRAPLIPEIVASNTPLSSSSSSLSSSSSSTSKSVGVQREASKKEVNIEYRNGRMPAEVLDNNSRSAADPDYQNVPVKKNIDPDEVMGCDEGDYERDMVVYEAITMGNDMIELVSHGSSSGSSSQASSTNRNIKKVSTQKTRQKASKKFNDFFQASEKNDDDQTVSSNVRNSVMHYENMVIGESGRFAVEFEKQVDANKSVTADISDDEDTCKKSRGSSLSLNSQNTVMENSTVNSPSEGRKSPEGQNSDEVGIVPCHKSQMPPKITNGSTPPSCDPIMLFDYDSPTETSDTETMSRYGRCSSPRTIETESTRSFGYVQPDKALRRRDTLVDHTDSSKKGNEGHRELKRSESFQAGDSEHESMRGYIMKRHGSTDLIIDANVNDQSQEVHINGRTFTKYTPQEVLLNNEMNELLTAALNRRQCRSVEDRLDQWLEEDLKRHNPENLLPRSKFRGKKRGDSRSSSYYDENRNSAKFDRNNNKNKVLNFQKLSKAKALQKRFSNSELIAFNGFINPGSGFIDTDYGSNFVLNKPASKRKTEFLGDKAEFGVHDFPIHGLQNWSSDGRWPVLDVNPDIPTPDYVVTPSGTLSPAVGSGLARHILDIPSGLY
ncbi:Formin FH3 domain [Trinorchestia longiramus]|nr:Formin FH3 domain [Trinorchestia longiramus]